MPTAASTAVVTGTQTISGTSVPTVVAGTTVTATIAPTAIPTPSKTWTTIVKGDDLDGSKVAVQFDSGNQPQVAFTLKGQGATDFANFTQSHIGQYMPIVLDKKVISAPVIQGAIIGGNGVINNISLADAGVLAQQLKYGALPVSLTLQSERKISATLGQEAIDKSIVAGYRGPEPGSALHDRLLSAPRCAWPSVALVIYSLVATRRSNWYP